MRTFQYDDLDGTKTVTEKEIVDTYFPFWSSKMREAGKEDLISEQLCIEDFCVINWAWEVEN